MFNTYKHLTYRQKYNMASIIKTYFTTFYRSIFSPQLYADVIHRWKGTGALYLLFLAFFIAIILSVRLSSAMLSVADQDLDHILNQIPVVEIKGGELSTDVERPHDIILQNGNVLLRFLETVDLDTVKQENKDIPIVLTSTQLIIIKDKETSAKQLRVQSLSDVDDVIIDRTIVKEFWDKGKWFIPLVAIPFVGIGLFIGYFVQTLVIAVISYVVTAFMKEEYIFETRLRMSAVAFTPIILINQLSELILHHKLNFVMMATMASLYVFVMIKTSRNIER